MRDTYYHVKFHSKYKKLSGSISAEIRARSGVFGVDGLA